MTRYDRRLQALAVGLAALAGYVDALGFLQMQGFFVSFMSGNSTRLAVGLVSRSHDALVAAGLVALFVMGVVLGSVTGRRARNRLRGTILLLVAAVLGIGTLANSFGAPTIAIAAMVLAMGAVNAVFEHEGEVHIGLTYMTGTLVKFGQRLAGRDPLSCSPYLALWLGLVGGAALGAFAFSLVGLSGLAFATVAAVITAFAAARFGCCQPALKPA